MTNPTPNLPKTGSLDDLRAKLLLTADPKERIGISVQLAIMEGFAKESKTLDQIFLADILQPVGFGAGYAFWNIGQHLVSHATDVPEDKIAATLECVGEIMNAAQTVIHHLIAELSLPSKGSVQ